MNNRLKFRVWNKHKGYDVDGNFVLDPDGILGEWDSIITYEEDEYIVEQCTGLKDKNGNLIYEGDVVSNGYKTGVVKYGEFNCSCCDGVYGWYFDDADIRDVEFYEIIGNIHEQAEQKE